MKSAKSKTGNTRGERGKLSTELEKRRAKRKLTPSDGSPKTGTMNEYIDEVGEMTYLINPWVPNGMLTLLAGAPKSGKSTIALWGLVRPIICGGKTPFFDGTKGPDKPGYVLWIDTENGNGWNRERVMKWDLPAENILFPTSNVFERISLDNAEHMTAIEDVLRQHEVKLVVLDSLRGATSVDENNSGISTVLSKVTNLVEEHNCAFVIVHHLRKVENGARVTANDIRGSNAIQALSRSTIGVSNSSGDKDGTKCIELLQTHGVPLKNKYGFEIYEDRVEMADPPERREPERELGPRDKAKRFLLEHLADGRKPATELIDHATEDGICSERTLKAVKKELGIVSIKSAGKSYWRMPKDAS